MAPPSHKEHPIRELLLHGKHPFPKDMETMLRRLQMKPGAITAEVAMDAYDWEQGVQLEAGRRKLETLCKFHGV